MTPTQAPILIAIDSPTLHPEAIHLGAATGRPVIDARNEATVSQHLARAHVALFDAPRAPEFARAAYRPGLFMLAEGPSDIDFETAMKAHAQDVFVLPAETAGLLTAIGEIAASNARGNGEEVAGTVIAVVGAAGGAGSSVLAAAIAREAADTHPVLIDAHPYSGGLDLLLGIEDVPGARWGDIRIGEGEVHREDLHTAFPATSDGIAVCTTARSTVADLVVVDSAAVDALVRPLSASGVTVVDTAPDALPGVCDVAVVVAPLEVRAAAAAARIAASYRAQSLPVTLVARHREWSSLTTGELEEITGHSVCAEVPSLPRLTREVEVSGFPSRPPRALRDAARNVLQKAGAL